jgi:hypothetical protein
MEPDPEHQKDDPELGQLLDRLHVARETGGERAQGHTGEEVAHDRGKPQAPRHEAADERVGERETDVHQERYVVHVEEHSTTQFPVGVRGFGPRLEKRLRRRYSLRS